MTFSETAMRVEKLWIYERSIGSKGNVLRVAHNREVISFLLRGVNQSKATVKILFAFGMSEHSGRLSRMC